MSVVINVVGQFDGKQLDRAQRELDKLGKKVKGQESKVQSMGRTFAVAGGAVAAAVGGQMVRAAVDFAVGLEELTRTAETTQRKFDTVFGEMSDMMAGFADANNEAFGVSEVSMQGFLAAIQDILIPLGFARDEAALMTQDIAELANALQEFTPGTTVDQAVGALTSALTGEREQLKQFGVVLKDADIKARLAEKGLEGLTGEALKQETAIASLELATELAADAVNAYSNRAGTAEAETKAMAAAIADAQQNIAEGLGPEIEALKAEVLEITVAFGYWSDQLAKTGDDTSLIENLDRQTGLLSGIERMIPGLSLMWEGFNKAVDDANAAVENQNQGQELAADRMAAHQAAASDTADTLDDDLAPAMEDTGEGAEEMSTAVADATKEMAEAWEGAIDDLAGSVGDMPGIFDDAKEESLRSVEEFIAAVDNEFEFIAGLNTLVAMGLDGVAAQFADQGYSQEALENMRAFFARPLEEQLSMEDEIANAERRRNDALAESVRNTAAFGAFQDRWTAMGEAWARYVEGGFNLYDWNFQIPVPLQPTASGQPQFVREGFPVLHDGGTVPGRPGQETFALLEAGETVIPAGKSPMDGSVNITINNPQSNDLNADISKAMTAVRLLGVV